MNQPKVYLAAPFFNPKQIAFVVDIEKVIERGGYRMFSPRKGDNALEMNAILRDGGSPPSPLRWAVFNDNCINIDDADLLVAVIDDFDSGVLFEIGYAYARQIPIVTITNCDFGCNLMLAHSVIGHLKSLVELNDVLQIGYGSLGLNSSMHNYGRAVVEIQRLYKTDKALKEGPDEREQFKS